MYRGYVLSFNSAARQGDGATREKDVWVEKLTRVRSVGHSRFCFRYCCSRLLAQAKLTDGREFAVSVVGSDPSTDIAVLRLNSGGKVPVVSIGDSAKLRVGQV